MQLPGPDHPITIEPNATRGRMVFNGRVVADTTPALILREASLRPVQYIPRGDADIGLFARSAYDALSLQGRCRPITA
jgi:uncharacterized protein (DUF427 family)